MLLAEEENLLDIMLEKLTEEEIPMDELEGDTLKMVDNHNNVYLWKVHATRMTDREEATAGDFPLALYTFGSRLDNMPPASTTIILLLYLQKILIFQ